jgi:glycosyltransferase involved in cell wall biosynthesis
MELNLNQLRSFKTSDRIYILGSGESILDISKQEWDEINSHNSIGFNHWYVHDFEPTFYDLSYLANDYKFEGEKEDMFFQASKKCSNSKFILNHNSLPQQLSYFNGLDYYKTHINHFDLFESQLDQISSSEGNKVGQLAQYWTLEFFNHFQQPHGELLPNENFIFKSRGQLFATVQLATLLGYKDIRLLGIDLNGENKFQDSYPDAPNSSKSVGNGGEKLAQRVSAIENSKTKNGTHSTTQHTTDKDYLGIHKLLRIFNNKCLNRKGVSLTVGNPNSLLVSENIKYQPIMDNLEMEKITFCIPSKSNLRYLKTCIPSIRENAYRNDHEIIIFVDSDEDGTIEWLEEVKDKYNLKYYVNPKLGEELYGIGMAYDFCIDKSTTDIFMIFHADMILANNADYEAYKHLKEKTVVCATRIEPPLHPNNGEKILRDFGIYPEDFKEKEFNTEVNELKQLHENDPGITEGIFAPWMMYKKEYTEILGGHDPILHSCREDSDIFNRMLLAGFAFIQTWEGFVYHFTGRGAGSFDGDSERHKKWQEDMNKSTLEFIRKWGTNVNHTPLMKPIVSPVYNKSVKIINPNPQLEQALEPWFNGGSDILVTIDGNTFTQQDYQVIQQLSAIIQDSGEVGEFELGNLKIKINSLTSYENELIKI